MNHLKYSYSVTQISWQKLNITIIKKVTSPQRHLGYVQHFAVLKIKYKIVIPPGFLKKIK